MFTGARRLSISIAIKTRGIMRRVLFHLCVLIFCCSLNALALGVPDAGFGLGGIANAGFGRGIDSVWMSALCPDGGVLTLGPSAANSFAVVKFDPQGAPDASFGNGGVINIPRPNLPPHLMSEPVAIKVAADGFIYIAGGHGPDMSVGKYSPGGALVQVFDGGETGYLFNGVAMALDVQADGSVVVAGVQGNEYGRYAVYHYLVNGSLDINFGSGGKSFVKMGWIGKPMSIRAENDGKFVVTGWVIPENSPTPVQSRSLIARYSFDGSLDSSFNTSGVIINPVRGNGSERYQQSFTLPDGRIMAAGTTADGSKLIFSRFNSNGNPDKFFGSRGTVIPALGSGSPNNHYEYLSDGSLFVGTSVFYIYKFGPDGDVDPSFGSQGMVNLPDFHPGILRLSATPNGKLMVAGSRYVGNPTGTGFYPDLDHMVARLNGDGSPDTTFDGDGRASCDVADSSSSINALALAPDGKLVVAGQFFTSNNSLHYGTGVSRYNEDGTPDLSFANRGKLYFYNFDFVLNPLGVKVQPDGKIVIAGNIGQTGSNTSGVRVIRLDMNGAPDSSFGAGGVFTYLQNGLNAFDMSLQNDGKIVLGGYSIGPGPGDFVLMRLNTDGTLDAGFGGGSGVITTDISGHDDVGVSMAIQPNGKILLGGICGQFNSDFCLARYNSNGVLDKTFGRRGVATNDFGTNNDYLRSVALAPNGNIVATGTRSSAPFSNLIVIRYTSKGLPDSSFATGGVYITPHTAGVFTTNSSARVMSDNSVVVATAKTTNTSILKLTAGGMPDESWAPNGLLNPAISIGGWYAPDCLLDSQERIVISGVGNNGGYIARFSTGK